MTNRLILNLRLYGDGGKRDQAGSKTDILFRSAALNSAENQPRSILNSIIGNIGEPLLVGDSREEDEPVVGDNGEELQDCSNRYVCSAETVQLEGE